MSAGQIVRLAHGRHGGGEPIVDLLYSDPLGVRIPLPALCDREMSSHINLGNVQELRILALRIVGFVAFASLFFVGTSWEHTVHKRIESVGLLLIVVCIIGRTFCALFISGRKGIEIVDVGPYSVCRNPLYLFSFVGAFGVGLLSGSIVIAIAISAIVWMIQSAVVSKEEAYLLSYHGSNYRRYIASTPRFWPDLSLWRSGDSFTANTRGILRTFADASLFLLTVPFFEGLEFLRETGRLPVFLAVP